MTEICKDGLSICENSDLWDRFCLESSEGSPFMLTWFTNAAAQNTIRYFWYKNTIPQAALLLHVDNAGIPIKPKFSSHHSLCYSKEMSIDIGLCHVTRRYMILDEIVKNLTSIYPPNLFLSFHPKVLDMRPLLWHNYDKTGDTVFDVDIRYTAVKNLTGFKDTTDLLDNIRECRKQEYKKSLKENISVTEGASEAEIIDLYNQTFERQGITVEDNAKTIIQNIIKTLNKDTGFIVAARNSSNKAIAVTLCLTDAVCAYSLIIANDPGYRNSGANTACVIGALMVAKNRGKHYFDFVGANSPKRGDYKLSFYPELRSYYEATLLRNEK